MVNPEDFRRRIRDIISQEYHLEFLGNNLDHIVHQLTDIKAEKIYQWIGGVVTEKIRPIVIATKKPYKDWMINQLLTFRYQFSIGNTEYRILFVKVKNSVYIEFHLGDHKYYDNVRKDLDLKKSNY